MNTLSTTQDRSKPETPTVEELQRRLEEKRARIQRVREGRAAFSDYFALAIETARVAKRRYDHDPRSA